MKVSSILKTNDTLKKIIDEDKNVKPVFKFRLLGILKDFEPYVENFEMVKNSLIVKYGNKDEETGNVSLDIKDDEVMENFNKDITDVLNQDIEKEFSKIKFEDALAAGVGSDVLIGLYEIMEI